LVPVSRNKKLAAVNTGNLVHIVAPFNTMNKNNYMDFLSFIYPNKGELNGWN
jgi:hypothetical protein